MMISAQFAVYPIGQEDWELAIGEACQALARSEVRFEIGSMSTLLEGDSEAVFAALHDALVTACQRGATVMTCTLSNACPVVLQGAKDDDGH